MYSFVYLVDQFTPIKFYPFKYFYKNPNYTKI